MATIRWAWVTPVDGRGLASYLGIASGLLAPGLVLPLTVAAATGSHGMALRLGVVVLVSSSMGTLAWRYRPPRLGLREALMVTGLAYPLWSVAGAFAYFPARPFMAALFEAASAITTTGLTALPRDGLSYAELFVRAWLQWVGGAGIAVLSVSLVGGVAAVALYTTERGRSEILGNVVRTAQVVLVAYGALSLVIGLALVLSGLPVRDALLYALAALSTGGFQPLASEPLQSGPAVVLVIGMLFGATPFVLYRTPRRFARDRQVHGLLAVVGLTSLVLWILDPAPLLESLFGVVTAMTTTGFTIDDAAAWSPLRKSTALVLMIIGGCLGSTAGGVKLFRTAVLLLVARVWIFRQLVPQEATLPVRYNGRTLEGPQVMGVLVFLATYMATLAVGLLGLAASGLTLEQAAFGSASALGTVGLWIGPGIDSLPSFGQALLIVLMWAGRVELLPLLLVLHAAAWRPHHRPNRVKKGRSP